MTKHGKRIVHTALITHIEAKGVHSSIFLLNKEPVKANHSLIWFEKKLPANCFFRCHRSILVNFSHIQDYNCVYFRMTDKSCVKISRHRKNYTLDRYNKFINEQIIEQL